MTYDDPAKIEAFMAKVWADTPDNADAKRSTDIVHEKLEDKNAAHNFDESNATGMTTPVLVRSTATSARSSPKTGIEAPPSTPASAEDTAADVNHLAPIDEASSEESTSNTYENTDTVALRHGDAPTYDRNKHYHTVPYTRNATAEELMQNDGVKNFQQHALSKFKVEAAARVVARGCIGEEQQTSYLAPGDVASPFDGPADKTVASDEFNRTRDVDYPRLSADQESSYSAARQEITPASLNSTSGVADDKESDTSQETKILLSRASAQGESREHEAYFTTWGDPRHRDGQPAGIRKVILSGLPARIDFTLLQSLVHGGAVEVMDISNADMGPATAHVTFTTAEACDKYYDKYPNGIEFKYKGRKVTVFVDKGKDVDVVSGALRSSLECGASRVIKVTGADDDWSMRALYRIAEGTHNRRKVEAIVDSYCNEIRTIIFRFTKIADAVTFRAQLLRNLEWEDADIQFMNDPCEQATGLHFT